MTAKQAGYERKTQLVTTSRPGAFPVHFVMTRHGAVARTWIPGYGTEIALWRPRNLHPQYQGTVTRGEGGWVATDPHGRQIASAVDYIDAEAALLPLHTRTRSHAEHEWPFEIVRELEWRRNPPVPTCPICGHPLTGTQCTRPDLHWGVDSDGNFRTAHELATANH